MKIFITIIFLCSLNLFASDELEYTHYKYFPKTPATSYAGDVLDFYSTKDAYGEFSNFALFPIELDGKLWASSEHYFQAQKFLDPALQEAVRNCRTPYDAAKMARAESMPLRADWFDIRDAVMLKALHAKFAGYKVLRDLLLSTNAAHIYEHTKNDCYWADCGDADRTGTNMLGKELMIIREELKTPNE